MMNSDFTIIGAGLAGCECALILAREGFNVTLYEQKPHYKSMAHVNDGLAELVCSNSLRSNELTSGVGLLKEEMRQLKSPFMEVADACRLPAGKALAVDREEFSRRMTERVLNNPNITVCNRQIESLRDEEALANGPLGVIVAAGPLASDNLAASLGDMVGEEHCYFYDAIAPVIWSESLNMDIVFRASRYAEEEAAQGIGDYLNCPFNRAEYERFYEALRAGETFKGHGEGATTHFEGCMPIEALAQRGPRVLTFGPLKPVGLLDPRTGKRPWAVLQLRAENANGSTCNLVGCQTKLLQGEQARIFRLVPGLENVEFARFGSMHRNTYVNAPVVLQEDLSLRAAPGIYLAGQITGVEGYVESAASGLWLGMALAAKARGQIFPQLPLETALGALLAHLRRPAKKFQPSNITFGLMPDLGAHARKKERKVLYMERAQTYFKNWLLAVRR